MNTCDDEIRLTNICLILSQKELYTNMEKKEEHDLSIEQNEPHRGRNGNNGRNHAPRPFIQPDIFNKFDIFYKIQSPLCEFPTFSSLVVAMTGNAHK